MVTSAVGPSAVNIIIGPPLLSDLVGVNEYNYHRNQADEGNQDRCAQSCIDVGDETSAGDKHRGGSEFQRWQKIKNLAEKRRGNFK